MFNYVSGKKKTKTKFPAPFQACIDQTSSLLKVHKNGDVSINPKTRKKARRTCTHMFTHTDLGGKRHPKHILMKLPEQRVAEHPELAHSFECGICGAIVTPANFSDIKTDLEKIIRHSNYLAFLLQYYDLTDKDATVVLDWRRNNKRMLKMLTVLADSESESGSDRTTYSDYTDAFAGRTGGNW
jgi:hypothetical protein